jgi:nitrogenase-stabilizing/protective protein
MTTTSADRLVRFRDCRNAEDYFLLLQVPFDPKVLNVHRLHILRHFANQLIDLHNHRAEPEDPDRVLADYRAALIRSYREFTESTALDHRLFKVLADRAPGAFIPLSEVGVRTKEAL